MNALINLLFGNLFEALFICVMFYKIKGLKSKKLLLFVATLITYSVSGIIISFSYNNQYLFYILFDVILYLFTKLIYKNKIQIIDLFIIYYIEMIINFSCLILMLLIGYNYIFFILNRLLLIIIMLFSGKLNRFYNFYYYNWNRHSDNKIKSVTIRNLTIISCNLMLYIINYFTLNYLIGIIS